MENNQVSMSLSIWGNIDSIKKRLEIIENIMSKSFISTIENLELIIDTKINTKIDTKFDKLIMDENFCEKLVHHKKKIYDTIDKETQNYIDDITDLQLHNDKLSSYIENFIYRKCDNYKSKIIHDIQKEKKKIMDFNEIKFVTIAFLTSITIIIFIGNSSLNSKIKSLEDKVFHLSI
jgi:hypothetical protein